MKTTSFQTNTNAQCYLLTERHFTLRAHGKNAKQQLGNRWTKLCNYAVML